MPSQRRQKLIDHYYQNKILDFEILLDNIWDPHNVSAITRSCDGFGVKVLNLYYTYNKSFNYKKIGKASSSSSNKWVLYNSIHTTAEKILQKEVEKLAEVKKTAVKKLNIWAEKKKKEGFKIVGTSLQKTSKVLNKFNFPAKTVLVIGNEKRGLSPEIEAICDDFVYIPMVGMVESYNVSVAVAVILYEVFKQKGEGLVLRTDNNLLGKRD